MPKPFPQAQIGEARRLRREERLSLREIAVILGVSKASCSHWVRDDPLTSEEIKSKRKLQTWTRSWVPLRGRIFPKSEKNRLGYRITEFSGEFAMLKFQLRAAAKHALVSRPTTLARYDAVVDLESKLYRVQVKYCNMMRTDGSYQVHLTSRGKVYIGSEIDALAVYIPETDKIYWLPVREFDGRTIVTLRLRKSRNGQNKNCRAAATFEW